jgi:hypothetical protein
MTAVAIHPPQYSADIGKDLRGFFDVEDNGLNLITRREEG